MAKLEAKLGMIVDSVGNFFSGKDPLPYCDSDIVTWPQPQFENLDAAVTPPTPCFTVATGKNVVRRSNCSIQTNGCEREVAEAGKQSSDEFMQECLMRLSWALVHSKRPEDVQRGIAMLEGSLPGTDNPLHQREKLYLLAVGYYRSGDYSRSRDLVEKCLMIAPDWRQALTLNKTIEERIKKDGVIGLGIAATALGAVGLIAGGIAAAVSRKK